MTEAERAAPATPSPDASPEDASSSHVPPARRWPWLWWLLGVAFVSFAAFVGSAIATWMHRSSEAVKAAVQPSTVTQVVRETPSIILAVRQMARLETTSFHMERVIDLKDRQTHLFGLVRGEDAILLIAAGDVTAGVDLATIAETDVTYGADGKSARVVLPEPIILSTRLDNSRTYVHSRTTDTFAERAEALETRARQMAEKSLHDAALEAGILVHARQGAERTLSTLIRSLGFAKVEIVFEKESDSSLR
jgi:hypothetical protein